MLRLDEITIRQGDFTLRANTELAFGARVAVMGASGAGKSTLLSLIAGFAWPDSGRVLIDGADLSRAEVAARPLSILFQDGNLFPHLSVFENVALGVSPSLHLSAAERDAVGQSLREVGLADYAARRPADLSGGQQSRVALARMLLQDRPLALLDEPFAALDPGLRREMLDLVRSLCARTGKSLIMVTHDLRDALRLCDHIWLLDGGALVLDAPLTEDLAMSEPRLSDWV